MIKIEMDTVADFHEAVGANVDIIKENLALRGELALHEVEMDQLRKESYEADDKVRSLQFKLAAMDVELKATLVKVPPELGGMGMLDVLKNIISDTVSESRISIIKDVRQATRLGLKESMNLVDAGLAEGKKRLAEKRAERGQDFESPTVTVDRLSHVYGADGQPETVISDAQGTEGSNPNPFPQQ